MTDRGGRRPALGRSTDAPGSALGGALVCLVLLAGTGAVGLALRQPWLFPSLGPTVMLAATSPDDPAARPVNALVGHGVALVVGAACLVALGLGDVPAAPVGGLTAGHVVAGSVSVAVTTAVLHVLRTPHPPAGATTLIVSLGILATPADLAVMAAAVLLVTGAAWAVEELLARRRA